MTFEIKEKNKRKGKPLSVCIWPEWPSSSHSRPKLPPLSLGSFRSNLGPAPRHPLSPSLWPKAGRPRSEPSQRRALPPSHLSRSHSPSPAAQRARTRPRSRGQSASILLSLSLTSTLGPLVSVFFLLSFLLHRFQHGLSHRACLPPDSSGICCVVGSTGPIKHPDVFTAYRLLPTRSIRALDAYLSRFGSR